MSEFLLSLYGLTEMPNLAYVDPLSGSVILQVLAAGALGGLFVIKRFWYRIAGAAESVRKWLRRR